MITNNDTFLCVSAPNSAELIALPQVAISWLHWITDRRCHMLVHGAVEHMRIFNMLPASGETGEFCMELRASCAGDHAHIADSDTIVLKMAHCTVSDKQILNPVVLQRPAAALIMTANVLGVLALLDLKAVV